MKKIINGLLIALTLFTASSCSKVDNLQGPNAGFKGNIIDKTTGKNILTETNGIQIKLEELSWSATPTPQFIPSKQDGTFEDEKLFKGHYRVTPYGGAFWPVTGTELDISGTTSHDFTITPYLTVTNVTSNLSGTTLTLTFSLVAPIPAGLPQIIDVKPFVNDTKFVGSGANINSYSDVNKITLNSSYADVVGKTYTLTIPNLKTGRTFYARVGVRVDDSFKQYNYSDVIEVQVP
ncbi:MAG: hypothetical protein JWR38_2668 [Mucilaginibacter sp.]|nr:hypothetical protein [Mucilaginibacter sp.]